MKKGEELGLAIIKCQNKEGTDEIKRIHYALNDIMYKYSKKYIAPQVAGQIDHRIMKHLQELNEQNVPQKAQAKKEELIGYCQRLIDNLMDYFAGYKVSQEDIQQVQATINFEVHRLVEAKKSGVLHSNPLLYLKEIREIRLYYVPMVGEKNVNTDTLYKFNAEILNSIYQTFGIGIE